MSPHARELRTLDWVLIATLLPLYLVTQAAQVYEGMTTGLTAPGVEATSASGPRDFPVVGTVSDGTRFAGPRLAVGDRLARGRGSVTRGSEPDQVLGAGDSQRPQPRGSPDHGLARRRAPGHDPSRRARSVLVVGHSDLTGRRARRARPPAARARLAARAPLLRRHARAVRVADDREQSDRPRTPGPQRRSQPVPVPRHLPDRNWQCRSRCTGTSRRRPARCARGCARQPWLFWLGLFPLTRRLRVVVGTDPYDLAGMDRAHRARLRLVPGRAHPLLRSRGRARTPPDPLGRLRLVRLRGRHVAIIATHLGGRSPMLEALTNAAGVVPPPAF